jgi:hypothetical protein
LSTAPQPLTLLERVRRFALPQGTVACRRFDLRQSGEIRLAPDKPWLPFEAEQWFDASGLDFHWLARARIARVLPVAVVDSFKAGHGLLSVRLAGILPVAGAEGPEVDRGEAMRALAETPWRPCAYAEAPYLTWFAPSANTLRASFNDGKTQCYVDLEVDAEGRVLGAGAPNRPRGLGNTFVETPWRGTFAEYRTFDGLRVPTCAEAAWLLPEGSFTYFRGIITNFQATGDGCKRARQLFARQNPISIPTSW